MIILIIILILCGPALVRSAEDSRRRAEAERRQAERIREADRKRAEAERRRDRIAAEAERRRDRIAAEARTVIEFWEPRRRDLLQRIDAEQDAQKRSKLETQLFQIEQRLQKAYWTLEN